MKQTQVRITGISGKSAHHVLLGLPFSTIHRKALLSQVTQNLSIFHCDDKQLHMPSKRIMETSALKC